MDGRAVDFENNQGTTICSPTFGHTSVCLLSSKFMFSQRRDHKEKNVNFPQGSLSLFLFYSPHPASLRGHYAAESGGLTEQVYNVDTGVWTVSPACFLGGVLNTYLIDIIEPEICVNRYLVHPCALVSRFIMWTLDRLACVLGGVLDIIDPKHTNRSK